MRRNACDTRARTCNEHSPHHSGLARGLTGSWTLPESRSLETSVDNGTPQISKPWTPRSSSPASHSHHQVGPGLCPRSSPGNGHLTTWAQPLRPAPTDAARPARQGDASSQAPKRPQAAGRRSARPPPSSPSPTSLASETKPRPYRLGWRAHPPRIASPPPKTQATHTTRERLRAQAEGFRVDRQVLFCLSSIETNGALLVGLRGLPHDTHALGAPMPLLPQPCHLI